MRIKNFNKFKLNESLSYCDSCHMLSQEPICNLCQILNILNITKDTDKDNIYGKLKYYTKFKSQDIKDVLKNYDLTQEQKQKIIRLLN